MSVDLYLRKDVGHEVNFKDYIISHFMKMFKESKHMSRIMMIFIA